MSGITGVETEIFASQIPGGMISNMESQLSQQGAGDKLKEVLAEVPRVREDAGFPPLVTPSSQIVGTQAVFNVLMGRYKVITAEFADLMLGYYGATLGERNPEVVAQAQAQTKKQPITCRPADLLEPEWEQARDRGRRPRRLRRHRRGRADLRDVPQGRPRLLRHRARRARNVGRDPAEVAAEQAAKAAGKRPVQGPITHAVTYEVTSRHAHSVSVERA